MSEIPNLLDGTEQFMRAAGQSIPDVPTIPSAATIAQRLDWLIEEVSELAKAVGFNNIRDCINCINDGDAAEIIHDSISSRSSVYPFSVYPFNFPEMIDAFHDIAVIAHGGALEAAGSEGAKATAAEVTRSNLAKIVDGKVLRRADGKIQKPPGFQPPDIAGALKASGWVEP